MGAISEYAELKHKEELLGNAVEWVFECFKDCEDIVRTFASWGFNKREISEWVFEEDYENLNDVIKGVFNEY